MKPVAFFDVDGTIFRSSLLIEVVKKLITEGVFPEEVQEYYEISYRAWQNREGSYDQYIDDIVRVFVQHIKGVHYGALADAGRQVMVQKHRHVYRYTRDLLTTLQKEGYMLVAISQSPKTIVDIFCEHYGFDKVYGRVYEIGPQDRFTGVIIDEHLIRNKASIVRRVFDKHPELTKEGSIAVGDTDGDIPLLESVERPICFNPNQILYTHAKRNGWEVVVERKDVIYTL
jgi:HAD superfamily hydrolase (TIGR01490 family)